MVVNVPVSNHLSEFAKEIIRDCADDCDNIQQVYDTIMIFCSQSGYTIEQVGKYARRVRHAIIKERVLNETPLNNPPEKDHLRTYLPTSNPTQPTNKNVKEELECGEVFV